jgi:hypothetical protein
VKENSNTTVVSSVVEAASFVSGAALVLASTVHFIPPLYGLKR